MEEKYIPHQRINLVFLVHQGIWVETLSIGCTVKGLKALVQVVLCMGRGKLLEEYEVGFFKQYFDCSFGV